MQELADAYCRNEGGQAQARGGRYRRKGERVVGVTGPISHALCIPHLLFRSVLDPPNLRCVMSTIISPKPHFDCATLPTPYFTFLPTYALAPGISARATARVSGGGTDRMLGRRETAYRKRWQGRVPECED